MTFLCRFYFFITRGGEGGGCSVLRGTVTVKRESLLEEIFKRGKERFSGYSKQFPYHVEI